MIHKPFTQWVQCTKRNPCPACSAEHHCTISTDGLVSKCMRMPGGKEIKQKDGKVAYIRRVSECGDGAAKVRPSKPRPAAQKLKAKELQIIIRQAQTALSPRRLKTTSEGLGVSEKALKLLGMGWDDAWQCLTFPMYQGDGKPCGIRLRRVDPKPGEHRYICVPGSSNGLFIPANFSATQLEFCDDPAPLVVVMPEGPTDVAAALDLGLMAVGRPSNTGAQREIRELLNVAPGPIDLVLMADRDGAKFLPDGTPYSPGWEGALSVAEAVVGHKCLARLRILFPPDGAKDLRAWFKSGGMPEVVAHAVAGGERVTREWLTHKRKALNAYKLKTKQLLDSKTATTPDEALRMARAHLCRRAAG